MKKIAVITPAYNSASFISQCIQSVSESVSFDAFELEHIIIDDKSKDDTVRIVEEHLKNSKNKYKITLLLNTNKGETNARNLALSKCDSDYIYNLDSDDVIFQNSLRYLINTAEKSQSNWVYGDFLRVNSNLSYLPGEDYYGWQFENAQLVLKSIFTGEHFFQQNCLLSRTTVQSAGNYDPNMSIANDLDLFIRILLLGTNPTYLPTPLYLHRFHDNNLTPKSYQENSNLHLKDLKSLYFKYEAQMKNTLNKEQILQISKALDI